MDVHENNLTDKDSRFTCHSAYMNLARISAASELMMDELEGHLSVGGNTEEWLKLHSLYALGLMIKQLSGELLEHNIITP